MTDEIIVHNSAGKPAYRIDGDGRLWCIYSDTSVLVSFPHQHRLRELCARTALDGSCVKAYRTETGVILRRFTTASGKKRCDTWWDVAESLASPGEIDRVREQLAVDRFRRWEIAVGEGGGK